LVLLNRKKKTGLESTHEEKLIYNQMKVLISVKVTWGGGGIKTGYDDLSITNLPANYLDSAMTNRST